MVIAKYKRKVRINPDFSFIYLNTENRSNCKLFCLILWSGLSLVSDTTSEC